MASSKSIFGRLLGISPLYGNLTVQGGAIDLTPKCVDASVTVSDESTNVRTITIQLKDQYGKDINYAEEVDIILYADAAKAAYVATGGSTGIAIGTDGALLTIVAKKYFKATSETDGDIDLTWTDTGTEAAYIGVKLPTGRIVMGSQALTNA